MGALDAEGTTEPVAIDDLPVQLELEILELLDGNDVVAASGAFAAGPSADPHQGAIDYFPTRRHLIHLVATPAPGGLAIEKQAPAGFLLRAG